MRNRLFGFLALLLSGCATAYQKEGVFSNGYSERKIERDTYSVTFRANEYTPPEKVKRYVLRRAAEMALAGGYSYFIVLEEKDESHYPSIRIKIKRYHTKPAGEAYEAHQLLR